MTTGLKLPIITIFLDGSPSSAEDPCELKFDLRSLVKHPNTTFYGRVKNSSMVDAGIVEGDIIVIDRSLEPKDGNIALCFLDRDFTVKRISKRSDGLYLVPANSEVNPIGIGEENECLIWGIVTYVIHKAR